MKKNLQKILVLALGLTTTIASAQFSANSTSRIDNSNSDDRSVTNRIALAADYGAVHVSADITGTNSGLDANGDRMDYSTGSYVIYEAYASTDLMGFGTLTVGKKDLSFGSGALISSNDWGLERYTQNGVSLDANLGGFDVSIGSMGGVQYDASNYMNASGNFGGADVNILMMNGGLDGNQKAHGYDLSYAMNNFTLSASMNSDFEGDEMTSYGLTYNVTDDLSASFGKTSYGDATETGAGFNMSNTATADGWANGNMGYLASNDEATTMGISYDLGDITLSYTMTTVSNDNLDANGDDATPNDREVTIMSLGYSLNDNCNVSMSRFSDNYDGSTSNEAAEEMEMTWLTISIGL
jgi:hypothetical protein